MQDHIWRKPCFRNCLVVVNELCFTHDHFDRGHLLHQFIAFLQPFELTLEFPNSQGKLQSELNHLARGQHSRLVTKQRRRSQTHSHQLNDPGLQPSPQKVDRPLLAPTLTI